MAAAKETMVLGQAREMKKKDAEALMQEYMAAEEEDELQFMVSQLEPDREARMKIVLMYDDTGAEISYDSDLVKTKFKTKSRGKVLCNGYDTLFTACENCWVYTQVLWGMYPNPTKLHKQLAAECKRFVVDWVVVRHDASSGYPVLEQFDVYSAVDITINQLQRMDWDKDKIIFCPRWVESICEDAVTVYRPDIEKRIGCTYYD